MGSFPEWVINIPCRKILFSRPRSRGLAAILGVCPARQCGSEHLSAQNAAAPLCLHDPIRGHPGGSLVPGLGSPGVEEKLRGFMRCLVKWVTTNHLLPRDKEQRTQTSILSPNANVGGPPDNDSVLWTHRSQIIPTFQDTSEVVLQSNIPVFK